MTYFSINFSQKLHLFGNEYSYPYPQKTTWEVNFLESSCFNLNFSLFLGKFVFNYKNMLFTCFFLSCNSFYEWINLVSAHFTFSLKHTSYYAFHTYSLHCSLTHSLQFFSLNLCKQVYRTASTRSVQFQYYHDCMMMKNEKKCNSTIFVMILYCRKQST